MSIDRNDCGVLNAGPGSWAFQPLAEKLSVALEIPIVAAPRKFNYFLHLDPLPPGLAQSTFVPLAAIELAADKRLLAAAFRQHGVPTPVTVLCETFAEVCEFVTRRSEFEWCLKYPTGCGGSGHRMIDASSPEPRRWPRPFVVQEFIRLERPEVYRFFAAGGDIFGWVARRFPKDCSNSPWVAHARGARYEHAPEVPAEAVRSARAALRATGLEDSFGCVDLLRRPSGEWVTLEVGTDGIYNHVDRDLDDPALEKELSRRLAGAFWRKAERIVSSR